MFEDLLYHISVMKPFQFNLVLAMAALCAWAVKELLDSWGIGIMAFPALAAGGLLSHVRIVSSNVVLTPEPITNTIVGATFGMILVVVIAVLTLAAMRVWSSRA
ncbi:MAG: hypothetical protein AAFZ58_17910 [Pseudomonadota bacterium]